MKTEFLKFSLGGAAAGAALFVFMAIPESHPMIVSSAMICGVAGTGLLFRRVKTRR